MIRWICAALILFAGTALAQEPPPGGEEEFDLQAAIQKVTKLMRESEKTLIEALGARKPQGDGDAGEKAGEALDDLLRKSRDSGQEAADLLKEIVEKAPMSQGQGQGQDQQKPNESEEERRRREEQKANDRDPQNSEDGNKPENADENKSDPDENTAKPQPADTDDPAAPDPEKEWMGRLPEQIRQAVKNGEFGKIPARFRELLQKYFQKVAEVESDR